MLYLLIDGDLSSGFLRGGSFVQCQEKAFGFWQCITDTLPKSNINVDERILLTKSLLFLYSIDHSVPLSLLVRNNLLYEKT